MISAFPGWCINTLLLAVDKYDGQGQDKVIGSLVEGTKIVIFRLPRYFIFEITFIFFSQYTLITCKRDLVLYRALLMVYNTFRAQLEDGSIRGAETCCCYKLFNP